MNYELLSSQLRQIVDQQSPMNDRKEELGFSGEAKEKIEKIFHDLSATERVELTRTVQKDPVNAKKLHQFVLGVGQTGKDDVLNEIDHSLTEEMLIDLRLILDSKDSNREESIENWISEYSDYFNEKTISSLDPYDYLTLSSLLEEESTSTFLDKIRESDQYHLHEKYIGSSSSLEDVLNICKETDPIDYSILSHYISSNKVAIKDLKGKLSNDELKELAPHLRYGDFRGLERTLFDGMLSQSAPKLNYLFIQNPIETLPENLHALHTLDCSRCRNLKTVPKNIRTLRCDRCPSLKLPEGMKWLEKLEWEGYRDKRLPEGMDKLKVLICPHSKLKELPEKFSQLEVLDLSNTSFKELPEGMNELREFSGRYCHFYKMPSGLKKLEKLDLRMCRDLRNLPEGLSSLKKLVISGCSEIKEIPEELENLEELDCSACKSLKHIEIKSENKLKVINALECDQLMTLPSEMNQLERMTLDQCSNLIILPEKLNALKNFSAYGCYNLLMLPREMDALQRLDIRNCSRLEALPAALPSMQHLNCAGCRSLQGMMPSMPQTAVVITENTNMDFTKFNVDLDQLNKSTKMIVESLGRNFLLANKPFPNIFYFLNGKPSEAVDAGGVRRDFVTKVFELLFKDLDNAGPSYLTMEDGFPLMDKYGSPFALMTVGALLGLCYEDVSGFNTGPLFTEDFYNQLTFFPANSLNTQKKWEDLSDNQLITFYQKHTGLSDALGSFINNPVDKLVLDENEKEHLKALLDIVDIPEDEDMDVDVKLQKFLDKDQAVHNAFKKEFIEWAKKSEKLGALYYVATGIKNTLGENKWNTFCQQPAEVLQKNIEGELSKELFLNQIKWSESKSIANERVKEVHDFVQKWVETNDLETIRKLVFAVAAKKALGKEALNFEIYNRGDDQIPVAHTCYYSLELSTYSSQEKFDKLINILLTEGLAEGGFQMG